MDIRTIEKAWRIAWMRAIGRMLPGPRTGSRMASLAAALADARADRPLKVLFVRYERIGDMIMSTGMIRVLATAHPHLTLDVLANPTTRPVLEHNPYVRRVFTLDRTSWASYRAAGRALRKARYDVIVDGRINNPPVFTSTPLLMWMARAPYRVGVGGGHNDVIYNVRVRPYDRATHYIEGSKALAEPFGVLVNDVDWQPELFLTDDETARADALWTDAASLVTGDEVSAKVAVKAPRLLVNLSASEPKRRWGDEHFTAVLQDVRAAHPHMPVIVMGLPSERDSVHRVAAVIGAVPAETPRLRDALALVGTASGVFTPDTSISHAASAFRRPAVVLLKRDHHPYAPWGNPAEIVFWDGETIHGLSRAPVRDAVMRLAERIQAP